MSSHRQFFRNTFWQFGLQVVKYLFPFITLPYLTRVLEPEGYALYAFVLSFMTFVQVFVEFGFNLSGTKQIAISGSPKEEGAVLGGIIQARLALCLFATLVVIPTAWFIPITNAYLGYTMLAFIAACGKALVPDFMFQGHEVMGPITVRFFVAKGVSTALTFVFVRSFDDVLWLPILDILSNAIALIWSFAVVKKLFGVSMSIVPMRRVVRELKEGGLYCFSNMAASVFTAFTTLFIGIVVQDPVQISYWSLAMTAVSAIQSLYSPIINSLYPHMVRGGGFEFARKIAIISIPVIIAISVAFAALSQAIVLVLGGEEYLTGSVLIVWVSPLLLFSYFAMLFGWPVLGAAGKVKEITATTVGSALFCIGALLGVSALGLESMSAICAIRVLSEMILCVSRFAMSKTLLCAKKDEPKT